MAPQKKASSASSIIPTIAKVTRRYIGKSTPPKIQEPNGSESDSEDYEFDQGLACERCEEKAGATDIHDPAKKTIRWSKFNTSRVTQRRKATTRQCYACFIWARSRKTKGVLHNPMEYFFPGGKKDAAKWDGMMADRKNWMEGNGWQG